LRTTVSLLPTPKATNNENQQTPRNGAVGYGPNLGMALSLLPTPTVQDASNTAGPSQLSRNSLPLNTLVTLFPTPRATDGTKGGPNQRGSSGDLMLPSAVTHLLPTPAVNDMGAGKTVEHWDEWTAAMQAKHGNGNGHGKSLAIEGLRIGASMPPPSTAGSQSSDAPRLPLPNQDPKADRG